MGQGSGPGRYKHPASHLGKSLNIIRICSILWLESNCQFFVHEKCFLADTFRHPITRSIAKAMAPRIVFTGGSGKAGRHVIPELIKRGYEVLNVDLIDFPDKEANVFTLKTDLTDSEWFRAGTL